MKTNMQVRVSLPERELLDAAEDLTRLLETAAALELSTATCSVLTALDDAVTEVYCRQRARAHLGRSSPPIRAAPGHP